MRLLFLCFVALLVAGCAAREVGTVRPALGGPLPPGDPPVGAPCPAGKVVWITIDGTSNTPVSRTAAARLHEMVEAHSYTPPGQALATWYAEGVGSAEYDLPGKIFGLGVDDDIRKAFAFLTQAWQPCDRLFLNGFSRGAYSVRALGGLLYMAGIPDLRDMTAKSRDAIVGEIFDAYKTRKAYHEADYPNLSWEERLALRRTDRIATVFARHRLDRFDNLDRAPGFRNPKTKVIIKAMTVWDSVQALGYPDRGEDPAEGPAHFLITACNADAIFQPLSLDDNRVYSFTPVLAGGPRATKDCPDPKKRQNVNRTIEETWFSGAHADVGGTYSAGAMLDGELASVSLNWVLERLRSNSCRGCLEALGLPDRLQVPEDRLSAIHDGKRTSIAYGGLYRQSRKPSVYWYHTYGTEKPLAVHASALERIEWLFALDETTPGCDGTKPPGKSVLCAKEIASHSLLPELEKRGCLVSADWGYRLKKDPACPQEVGLRTGSKPAILPTCHSDGSPKWFEGMVYKGRLHATQRWVVERVGYPMPYPRCLAGRVRSELTALEAEELRRAAGLDEGGSAAAESGSTH